MDRLKTYLHQCLRPQNQTEFYEGTEFNHEIFDDMVQDGLMLTQKAPPNQYPHCEYVKISDYYLIRKTYRHLDWLKDNEKIEWDLTSQPLYRRLIPPPDESVDQSVIISSVISQHHPKDKNYIEYGIRSGENYVYISQLVKQSYGVDINDIPQVPNNGKFFKMYTDDFSMYVLPQLTYHFAFIDADHNFKSCLNDFKNVYRYLQPGGYIFLHDTYPCCDYLIQPSGCHDCYKTPIAIREQYPSIEMVTLPLNPGVTIIRKED